MNRKRLFEEPYQPRNFAKTDVKKVGIIGAGMMGAGIAYVCAEKGIEVTLIDRSLELAQRGKAYSQKVTDRLISKDKMQPNVAENILGLITVSDTLDDLAGSDIVIEAVFEDAKLKAEILCKAASVVDKDIVFASNTSSLPITGLAKSYQNEEKFIGLHFFSPVDRMPLVEIIMGERTNADTLAKAYSFVKQMEKMPIIVNDSRGFFTSRVFALYVNEGIAMLGEGVDPALIESAAKEVGMPVGPLAVADEVSLSLINQIRDQKRNEIVAQGDKYEPHFAEQITDKMEKEFKRAGRAAGGGFYDYPQGEKKRLWSGLRDAFYNEKVLMQNKDIQDRMLFIQCLETIRCLEEDILISVNDANVGSIMGIGFPKYKGGAIQYVNDYGVQAFYNRSLELTEMYGERFTPPVLLEQKQNRNELF